MIGYCSKCKNQDEMEDVFTDQMPNGRLVHKGRCAVCGGPVWKTVRDEDIVVTQSGRYIPKTIFVGKNTPKRITSVEAGQTLIMGKEEKVVSTDQEFKNLKQIKEEAGVYEKENFITR